MATTRIEGRNKSVSSNRCFYLDWLRIMAILVVFIYHSTRFFNLADWHVKNATTYVWVEIFDFLITRWMMPLFFVISGASLFYALGKVKGFRTFYEDKFLRLFIPVLIASVTHGTLQVYLERLSHGRFSGSFFAFIPTMFKGMYSGIGMSGSGHFANVGMHLWYLVFLFVYSLICYRLFIWLKAGGNRALEKVMSFSAVPGMMIPIFMLPLIVLKALIPETILDVGNGGWGFIYYLWFLIAGFFIISSDRLKTRIQAQRWVSLFLAVVSSAIYIYLLFGVSSPAFQGGMGDWVSALLNYFTAWSWLFAILGFATRRLSFGHPRLNAINEGVLPFFIAHQTVLLVIGYFVTRSNVWDVAKWAIISLSSFVIIIALYILIIRRFNLFRFLFGMKTARPFYRAFRKLGVLILLPVLWIGLTAFSIINGTPNTGKNRLPMAIDYQASRDILLTADTFTQQSKSGVRIVKDNEASTGKAIEFFSGASGKTRPNPNVFVEAQFRAPAGRYFIWIRGKSDTSSELTDSFWLQVDNQIRTAKGGTHLGNWNTYQPSGVYTWGSDVTIPAELILTYTGEHTIRLQPRQVPHRIDQIWLSQSQYRIPDSNQPIR